MDWGLGLAPPPSQADAQAIEAAVRRALPRRFEVFVAEDGGVPVVAVHLKGRSFRAAHFNSKADRGVVFHTFDRQCRIVGPFTGSDWRRRTAAALVQLAKATWG